MLGIIGLATLLVALGLSLVITRLATTALTLTGLSTEAARFQARSAFTGTGFTTREAEQVVNHPVRRKINMLLMIVRSAGLVTIIISLMLSFVTPGGEDGRLMRLCWLLAGVAVLWAIASSNKINQYMTKVMEWALQKWTDLDTRDYAGLLKLSGEYSVMNLQIRENDWLCNQPLRETNLREEGVIVLGITRSDGSYVGVPRPETELEEGDTLVVYGRSRALQELDTRNAGSAGEQAHQRAVDEESERMKNQDRQEEETRKTRQEERQREQEKEST